MTVDPSAPIRVLVVDDSPVVRRIVCRILQTDARIEVIGTAADPLEARDFIERRKPDVLTLDLEMPRMDGLTFLRHVMRERPMRVIVMSSLTGAGSRYALEALRLGAVDVLQKPADGDGLRRLGRELIERVHVAADARLHRVGQTTGQSPIARRHGLSPEFCPNPRQLILLGASTGGIEALREVITALPANMPPIAVVQHIPAGFSRTFAQRLDEESALHVVEASHDFELTPGTVVIAAGGHHLTLQKLGASYRARLSTAPPMWHQRPAVDVLFRSVAQEGAASHVIAGILTGMGQDGAEGLRSLRDGGAMTFAQDQATSIVYGMPRAAWERGGAVCQKPIDQIAHHLQNLVQGHLPSTTEIYS